MEPDITPGQVYHNDRANFDVRMGENRGERGEHLTPFYLVQVRPDASTDWITTADSTDAPHLAGARAKMLLKRSTRPPELGG